MAANNFFAIDGLGEDPGTQLCRDPEGGEIGEVEKGEERGGGEVIKGGMEGGEIQRDGRRGYREGWKEGI